MDARVRKNLGSDFVVLGSYLDLGKDNGGQIRLNLRLEDTLKGETVAAVSETGTEKSMIDLAAQAGARLRQRFGLEKLSQLESEGVKAEQPSNPEALRPYAQGLASIRAFDDLAARQFLNNAVATDPFFLWLTPSWQERRLRWDMIPTHNMKQRRPWMEQAILRARNTC